MIRLRGVRVDPGDRLMSVRLLKIPGNYCIREASTRQVTDVRPKAAPTRRNDVRSSTDGMPTAGSVLAGGCCLLNDA
jgi:hypothetical protein